MTVAVEPAEALGSSVADRPDSDEALSHRAKKKLATRNAIHEAAFDLAMTVGLAHTTVERISERAGIAPRTFWGYFSSKEDAVINRDPEGPSKLAAAFLLRPGDEEPLTSLQVILDEYLAAKMADSEKFLLRQRLFREDPALLGAVAAARDEMERCLVFAVAKRLGVDPAVDLRPGVFVASAWGACRVAQQRWVDSSGQEDLRTLTADAFRTLADGVVHLTRKSNIGTTEKAHKKNMTNINEADRRQS